MSATRSPGILGIFDSVDATVSAIHNLRDLGVKRPTVFTPAPNHDIEHALDTEESPVRLFTLVGGLTGAATGFALATWTSMDWPLVTGGKPIISLPAWVIIAFELTILFGALSTVIGLFINARLPQRSPTLVYDRSFSVDQFGVYVVPPADREEEVRRVFAESGAVEVRHGAREVTSEV
ncbi:MAG: DUF3341 domain-containing protein [Candidatus Cloacimonetes bacterium]|jgi:hypothetical protein|nr:DUF3341 domain-containing protein [Candidatus Cloacimonadota bacterium]